MKVAVLFSGGKDSTFALKVALDQGWDVKYLVTILPRREGSWMFHYPCSWLTKLQSQAVGIMHVSRETEGRRDEEIHDLKDALDSIRSEIDGVVTGAIASRYQKDRIDALCKELDLKNIHPLWGKNQETLLKDMLENGMEIIFTGVSCEGLDKTWIGKKIDGRALGELRKLHETYGINISGEGGEYETLVTDAPFFKKRLVLDEVEKVWDEKTSSGKLVCKSAKLIDK